jgi:hypothetical protein
MNLNIFHVQRKMIYLNFQIIYFFGKIPDLVFMGTTLETAFSECQAPLNTEVFLVIQYCTTGGLAVFQNFKSVFV